MDWSYSSLYLKFATVSAGVVSISNTEQMQCAKYNVERLVLYEDQFDRIIANEHCEDVATNLLIDIRWAEVSRAFVNCLCRRSAVGPIRPLGDDYGHLIARAADSAFGTHIHAQIPSWFLQNNETFLASCLHKLFVEFGRRPTTPLQMHRAFAALFDVAEGLRPFLGLRCLSASTGAHALMCAAAHAQYDFLSKSASDSSVATLCFAEMLAERLLEGDAPEAHSAFVFFAQSDRWQAFAKARLDFFSVDEAFARLQRLVRAQTVTKQDHGLFFLASSFLDADAVASDASPERPSSLAKPLRSIIRKRSDPFVRLVRRLVSEA